MLELLDFAAEKDGPHHTLDLVSVLGDTKRDRKPLLPEHGRRGSNHLTGTPRPPESDIVTGKYAEKNLLPRRPAIRQNKK